MLSSAENSMDRQAEHSECKEQGHCSCHSGISDRIYMDSLWCGVSLAGPLTCTSNLETLCRQCSFWAAADGGLDHLHSLNILPQIFLGDMDSVAGASLSWTEEAGLKAEIYPRAKDATDGELILNRVIAEGYTRLLLIGALGGKRLDHMLSMMNYCLMLTKNFGLEFILTNGEDYYFPLSGPVEKTFTIKDFIPASDRKHTKVSLISQSDLKGLTIKNLAYALDKTDIPAASTRTVSNEFNDAESFFIALEQGQAWLALTLEKE